MVKGRLEVTEGPSGIDRGGTGGKPELPRPSIGDPRAGDPKELVGETALLELS